MGTELSGLDNISLFSKCRTVGRHAGDHHGSPFPNRVLCVDTSKHIYRHVTLTVNSFFTQSLQFINCLYLAKLKYFSFQRSYECDLNIFRNHFLRRIQSRVFYSSSEKGVFSLSWGSDSIASVGSEILEAHCNRKLCNESI